MNESILILLNRVARWGAATVAAIGAVAFFGWIFNIDALTRVMPGLVTMKINTACALIAVGIASFAAVEPMPGRGRKGLVFLLATLIGLLGLITLAEYLFSIDLRIDEFLISETRYAVETPNPGRMAPMTAFAFMLIGGALPLQYAKSRFLEGVSQALCFGVLLIALLTLVGYGYSVKFLFNFGPASSMALHTALAFLLEGIVLLALRPTRGFMKILTSSTVAGTLARRLSLLLPTVIFAAGGIRIKGPDAGVAGYEFDIAVIVVLSMAVSAVLVAWQTGVLYEVEMAGLDLQKTADTDPLTGLHNRRSLTRNLDAEWRRAQRYHGSFSLVMIDIDHFKSYNDEHGHLAGDVVLQQFAKIILERARGIDFAARYGGEEFLIVLPGTDEVGAMVFAERLREAVEAATFPHRKITASFGVASSTGHPGEAEEVTKLIGEADKALYLSKNAGRNRVTLVQSNPDPPEMAS